MLMSDCTPKSTTRPAAASRTNGSSIARARRQAAEHDERENQHQRQTDEDAELLRRDGEDEVGVRVRQDALDHALARPAAEPAAATGWNSSAVSTWKVSPDGGDEEAVDAAATCGSMK